MLQDYDDITTHFFEEILQGAAGFSCTLFLQKASLSSSLSEVTIGTALHQRAAWSL